MEFEMKFEIRVSPAAVVALVAALGKWFGM